MLQILAIVTFPKTQFIILDTHSNTTLPLHDLSLSLYFLHMQIILHYDRFLINGNTKTNMYKLTTSCWIILNLFDIFIERTDASLIDSSY